MVFLLVALLPSPDIFRSLYMPTLGISISIAQGFQFLSRRVPRVAKVTLTFVLLNFALSSILRSFDWQTEESLLKSCLRTCTTAKMHYNVAKVTANKEIATKHYEKALALRPSYEDAMLVLGQIYKSMEKYADAEDLYRKALRNNPKCTACWLHLGNLYHEMEKFVKAIHHFEEAMKLEPEHVDAFNKMALSRKEFLLQDEYFTTRKQVGE